MSVIVNETRRENNVLKIARSLGEPMSRKITTPRSAPNRPVPGSLRRRSSSGELTVRFARPNAGQHLQYTHIARRPGRRQSPPAAGALDSRRRSLVRSGRRSSLSLSLTPGSSRGAAPPCTSLPGLKHFPSLSRRSSPHLRHRHCRVYRVPLLVAGTPAGTV